MGLCHRERKRPGKWEREQWRELMGRGNSLEQRCVHGVEGGTQHVTSLLAEDNTAIQQRVWEELLYFSKEAN